MKKTTTKTPIVTKKDVEEAAKRCSCKDCACLEEDADLKAKQMEWYDSMIEGHKQQMKDSSRNATLGFIVMILSAIAMLTIIVLNIIRGFTGA